MYKGVGRTSKAIRVALIVLPIVIFPRHAYAEPDAWLGDAHGRDLAAPLSAENSAVPPPNKAAAQAPVTTPSAANKAVALPELSTRKQNAAKPATAIGRVTLPADNLTGARNVWGVALNLNDPAGAAGQSLTVLAGATPPSSGTRGISTGYTTGLTWARNAGNGDRMDMSVYFSQPSESDGHGQWLASMRGHLDRLPLLPGVRLETEMAVARDDQAQAQNDGGIGSLVRLIGSPGIPLNYQLTFSRFGAGFQPQGFVLQSGREAVTADVHYRLSRDVSLDAITEYAEENFQSSDPYWHSKTALALSGPILQAYLPALSATVKTSAETNADYLGSMALETRRLDMALAQPLWDGWRYRFSVAMNQTIDNVGATGFDSRDFHIAGNHRVDMGRFSGSIGPGMAWRTRNGYDAHQDFEAGVALKLRSRTQTVAFDVGYLTRDWLSGVYSTSSVKFGLNYSLRFSGTNSAGDDSAWYLSDAEGF